MWEAVKKAFAFLKGRKTQIAAYIIGILGIIEQYAHEALPAEWQGMILMAIAILMYSLRQVTDTPPGKSDVRS